MKASVDFRVPLADLDGMRTVYHPNFIKYFDYARTKLFRDAGLAMERWEECGVLLPLVSCRCDYKEPALFDDPLRVTAEIAEIRGKVITVDQYIENLDTGRIITTGQVVLVSCDRNMKPLILQDVLPDVYAALTAVRGNAD